MSPDDAGPTSLPTRRGVCHALASGGMFAIMGGTAAARAPAKTSSQEEALLEMVRARYGKHLTAEQLEALGKSLKRGLTRSDEMKRVPLTNADDPAAAFRADLP